MELTQRRWQNCLNVVKIICVLVAVLQAADGATKASGHDSASPPLSQEAVARRNDGVFFGLGGLDMSLFDLDKFFEQAAPTRTAALTTRSASTSRPSATRSSASRGSTASPVTRTSASTRSRATVAADDGAIFEDELGPNGGNFPTQTQHRPREIDDDSNFRSPTPVSTSRGAPFRQPSSSSSSSSSATSATPRDGSGREFSRHVEEIRDDPRHQRQSFRGHSPNGHASFENDDRQQFVAQPQPDRFSDFNQPPQRQADFRSQSPSSQFVGGGGVFRPALTQPPQQQQQQQHAPFRPSLPSLPSSNTAQQFTPSPPPPETRRPTPHDAGRDNDHFDQRQFDTQRPNAEDDGSFQQPPRAGDEPEERRPFTGQSRPSANQRPSQQTFRDADRPFFPPAQQQQQDQRPRAFVVTTGGNDRPVVDDRSPRFGAEQTQHDRPSPSHFDFGTGVTNSDRHRLEDDFFDGPSQGPPPQDVDDFVEEARPTSSTNQRHRDQDTPSTGSDRQQSSERPASDERAPPVSSERPSSDEAPFFFDSGSQEDPRQFHDPTASFQQSQEGPFSDEIRDDGRHTTEDTSAPPPSAPVQQQHRRPQQDSGPPIQTFRPPVRFQPPAAVGASSAFRNSDPSQQAAVHETIHRFPSTVPAEDLQRDQLHDRFIDSLSVHQKQRQQLIQPHPDNFRSHQRPVATVSSTTAPPVFRGTAPSRAQHSFRQDDTFRPQTTFSRPTPTHSNREEEEEEQRPGASSRGVTPHFFQQANAAESTGQLSPSFVRATEPTNFEVLDRRPSTRVSPQSNVHHQSRSSSSDFLPTSATVRSQSPLTPTTTERATFRTKQHSGEQSGRRRQPNRSDGGRSVQSPSSQQDESNVEEEQQFQLPHHLNAGLVSKFHHGTPRSQDHLSQDTSGDDFTFRRPSSSSSSQQIEPNAHRTSSNAKRLPATDAGRRGSHKRGRPSSTVRTTAKQFATENTIEDEDDGLDPVPSRFRSGGHSGFSGGGGAVAVAGQVATTCHPENCRLPKCFCGGNQIQPGNLEPEEIPQMIVLTFDDAVNDLNAALYNRLFYQQERLNPNGCNMLSTFYVSHEWTDYAKVQNLYAKGHEMASHSISHLDGRDFSKKKWYNEVYGQKEIMSVYAGVQLEDVKGMRSPFLAMGGDKQFTMLYETNFTYDTSMTVTDVHPPYWPYTLDYAVPHRCAIPPCPKLSYPGFWEIPMVALTDLNGGKCSMADSCSFSTTEDGIYEMLMKNFERHYKSNRAPFGLYYHASWFLIPHRQEGFVKFLEEIMKKDDVYLVTALQMLEWVKNPTPLSRIKDFEPWQCNKKPATPPCSRPSSCELRFKGDVRYMSTCHSCPDKYPWVGDTGVTKHAHTISA